MTQTQLNAITADEMRIAAAGVVPLPIEQAAVWEGFEESQGHSLWGRYEWYEGTKRVALIALYRYSLRGVTYLWAKHGPVWLKEATPARERALRDDLRVAVHAQDPSVAFIRLNATYADSDLRDPLQIITYDRTVIIKTYGGDAEKILEDFTKEGRRQIRRSLKNLQGTDAQFSDETARACEDFSEYYGVLCETAQRDGFSPHPAQVYTQMLSSLGAEHARLYAARVDGELACWDLVLINDGYAECYYGATTARSRTLGMMPLLDYEVAQKLGVELAADAGIDLMGAHSPRVPELFGVGKYKLAFATSYTDVPGGWDLPLKPRLYGLLAFLLRIKRSLSSR